LQPTQRGIKRRQRGQRRIGDSDLLKACGRDVEMLLLILNLRGKQVNAIQHRRVRAQSARLVQDRESFLEMPIFHFQLRVFQQSRRQNWELRTGPAQRSERLQCPILPPEPKVESREIPLGKRAARFGWITRPTVEFGARRLFLSAVKLIQLRENTRKIDIERTMLDKIFQGVVAVFWIFQLQMRVSQREQR